MLIFVSTTSSNIHTRWSDIVLSDQIIIVQHANSPDDVHGSISVDNAVMWGVTCLTLGGGKQTMANLWIQWSFVRSNPIDILNSFDLRHLFILNIESFLPVFKARFILMLVMPSCFVAAIISTSFLPPDMSTSGHAPTPLEHWNHSQKLNERARKGFIKWC